MCVYMYIKIAGRMFAEIGGWSGGRRETGVVTKGKKITRGILVLSELLSVVTAMGGTCRPMQVIILSENRVLTERHTLVEGDLWKPE